ncbi:hypothetical protein GCM10010399_64190 [Dactylosporangium fulvum]|uniref:Uncharacterized protein n=1 Tax=Dactylosporangium fulvum TaxID=53359 RepID=A0ABY5W6X3_9ACTN|nr:hypothetical protein [Dactylosporangium fulvum]UWP85758.1 hypothetical protein Dfulv_16560 [Dactylosporangium fulvum]
MTAPRVRGRAELEHPPWCQAELCSLETIGVGGCHQREFVVTDDEGRKIASVLLRQYASGVVTVGAVGWRGRQEWPPAAAELVARTIVEATRYAGRMARAA